MKYRVVVTSCQDAGILAAAQCTNTSLVALEEFVMGSLYPDVDRVPTPPHWTHLLIDEVSVTSNVVLASVKAH
jgi:hypothetical protein